MAAVVVLIMAAKGYYYGAIDQSVLLPFARYFRDPTLYPGDLMVDSLGTMQPLFWHLLGLLGRFLPLAWAFLGIHIVSTLLSALAVWMLGASLFRDRWSARLGLVLVGLSVHGDCFLAQDSLRLAWSELTQRSFAFPWILFALVCVVRGRPLWAAALSGLMMNVHPISGVVGAGMVFAGIMCDRTLRRHIVIALALFCLFSAPVLVNFTRSTGVSAASDSEIESWLRITRLRMSHHFYPAEWGRTAWFGTALILILGLRSIASLRQRWNRRHSVGLAFLVFSVGIWGPAYLFTEVVPWPLVIQMQLFRSAKFAALVCFLYFAHHERLRLASGGARTVLGFVALAAPIATWFSIPAAGLLTLAHLWPDRSDLRVRYSAPVFAATAIVLLVLGAAAALSVRERAAADSARWWGSIDNSSYQAQLWVRENTDKSAMVMVEPRIEGFRAFSERSIVGAWKDGGIHQNHPANLTEWWERMQALGIRELAQGGLSPSAFSDFGEGRMLALARRYSAQYVVTRADHDLSWPTLYSDSHWRVYGVPCPSD